MVIPFILRFYDTGSLDRQLREYSIVAPFVSLIFISSFYVFKLYHRAWAYAGTGELMAVAQAVTAGSLGVIALTYFISSTLPRSIMILSWAFIILLVGGSRLAWRVLVEHQKGNSRRPGKRALIVGAGDAGVLVARELKNQNGGLAPVGFIDDDPDKQRLSILGLPVLGKREQIPSVVKRRDVALIIIAMPSVDGLIIRELVQICRSTPAEVKILPGVYQFLEGHVSVSYLRPVQLEDLLHREPVSVDLQEIAGYLKGETVLVTGAGGSIGSELCRQVAGFSLKKLVLLDHGENGIHDVWLELKERHPEAPLTAEIADIRDRPRIDYVFQKHRPAVVFHAAAHKHVPLMERHPDEAVKTNVFGARNLAEAADRAGVKVFVMISTDKAVNPSSVMGATKRMAELLVQQLDRLSETRFCAVRFGNVLGSNGSVVPIFERQIKNGGPVTITHPEMKRYFMTISEAVSLVIQAGAMAEGGEIFILDMGQPVKIVDLARDLIRLSGLDPDKDMAIKFTGIRPGEKLSEELLTPSEGATATRHRRIFTARPLPVDMDALETELARLYRRGLHCTADDIFAALAAIVPGFKRYRQEQAG